MAEKAPTRLFDALMHSEQPGLTRQKAFMQGLLRSAHRYVLSDSAAVAVARAIISYPEMLVDNGQFAIPPFERTWIEFPSRNYNYEFTKQRGGKESDRIVGYLIDGHDVWVASCLDDLENAAFMPFYYHLHRPMTLEDEQKAARFFQTSRGQLDGFFWGHTFAREYGFTQAYLRGLRSMHSFMLDIEASVTDDGLYVTREGKRIDIRGAGQQLFMGGAGELRNIIGMILALNQPAKYKYVTEVGHRRQFTSRGTKVYMSHSVIEFNLGKRDGRRLLKRNKDIQSDRHMRWHQVRGHFCHDAAGRQETGCDHGGGQWWVEVDERKWECLECGGKRWWREYPNGHGTAQIGFVDSRHFVRARG